MVIHGALPCCCWHTRLERRKPGLSGTPLFHDLMHDPLATRRQAPYLWSLPLTPLIVIPLTASPPPCPAAGPRPPVRSAELSPTQLFNPQKNITFTCMAGRLQDSRWCWGIRARARARSARMLHSRHARLTVAATDPCAAASASGSDAVERACAPRPRQRMRRTPSPPSPACATFPSLCWCCFT